MKVSACRSAALGVFLTGWAWAESPAVTARLDAAAQTVRVEIEGSLFTELIYGGQAKPVLFPIVGPGGVAMVRQWPLRPAAPDEEQDHPHHKGMWFTHGSVDGVDFWKEGPDAGRIAVQGVPKIVSVAEGVMLQTRESWQKPDGAVVLTSATEITCGAEGEDRFIDYAITLMAGERPGVFGDTKEGSMGLRTSAWLNLKGAGARGQALTSEGKTGLEVWGTAAKWIDYSAVLDGGAVGVACFDHPDNLRHPTTWHARDYGLVAANPFGLHDFQKKPKGAGDYVLKPEAPLRLRYRWLFHRGDAGAARLGERWKAWAGRR